MQIANPIYDVVFKYLMDDNQIAKIMLSAIIGEEIETLEYKPQELPLKLDRYSITVYRLDFSAKIKTEAGDHKQVIVEIQKAKFPTDIMRFRKYLGLQYISNENTMIIQEESEEKKVSLPIISIYFLGHRLKQIKVPVIKVNRQYIDISTGNEIKEQEEFIESLTHNSFVIQIPELKGKRRNELEILLSVFDQSNILKDHHILNIKEGDFPEKYRGIIRKLQMAVVEPEVRQKMDLEDEIIEELENKERKIAAKEQIIEEKDKALEEKDRALEENKKALEENKKTIEYLKKQLEALNIHK